MATYGLKYQSDFYNIFKKLVSVKIYKQDYVDPTVYQIRTSQVTVNSNYQDDNTPIIGTGAKVVIIADTSYLLYLEDLLLSYERQFMLTLEYNSVIVYRGYSICDLNERQLLPFAEVTMQFVDYVRRLEGVYASCLKTISDKTDILTLINEFIAQTTLNFPLYVNSTLFEENMNKGATDVWLSQIKVQNAVYFENNWKYDNIYDSVNKALQTFSAFIYSFEDKWIIERQEDILRTGNWVLIDGIGFSTIASLKQEYNKQDGDFQYINTSQIIEYDSGLHTLTLRLKDKLLDSLVFNNFKTNMLTSPDLPTGNSLTLNTWYRSENILTNPVVSMLWQKNMINNYLQYFSTYYTYGLYYKFTVQFNRNSQLTDSSGHYPYADAAVLYVNYKASTGRDMSDVFKVETRFLLRISGGTLDGYWLQKASSIGQGELLYLYPPSPNGPYQSDDPANFCYNKTVFDCQDTRNIDWEVNFSIDLSRTRCVVYVGTGGSYNLYDSFEQLIGYEDYQDFILMVLPSRFANTSSEQPSSHMLENDVVGDFAVTITAEKIMNCINFYLNENFIKTEEIDLYLFDLPNINYANGLLEANGTTLTRLWTSAKSTDPIPLYEVYGKCKFRKYGRTIHRLKGKILCDKVLKIFSILTDDNILGESSSDIKFILNGYTWDLNEGTYDIEAEEYTDEDILVNEVAYNDADEPVPPGEEPLAAPSNLHGTQLGSGLLIRMSWNAVTDAVGYILERKPQIYNGIWIPNWKVIKSSGSELTFDDQINLDTPELPDDTHVTYRVSSYNDKGTSVPSGEVIVHYYT